MTSVVPPKLGYVYVSIVLKKNVAMFIFGCGIGNVRM